MPKSIFRHNYFGYYIVVTLFTFCSSLPLPAHAATGWGNLEPFKSRRADVERVLGRPLADKLGNTEALRFRTKEGTATVAFVTAKFVSAKQLAPEFEGTVLQIIVQHDNSSVTPESLGLTKKSEFAREAKQNVVVFRNVRDGLVYTFVDGKLKTTYYVASAEQQKNAQKKNQATAKQ